MHNLIFGPALFYDLPEYLQIVLTHTFWQSLTLGHFPIHPVFMAILWPFIKVIPVNVIAMFFGIVSIIVISKISAKSAVLYALFPLIWIINTNLMVESVSLFFYVLATYSLLRGKKFWFTLSIFLLVGTHLQSIFWIPGIFLTPLILKEKIRAREYIKLSILGTIFALGLYLILYKFSGRTFAGSTEQLTAYFSSGILRMIRNIWLSFSTSFGSLTLFLLGLLVIRNVKTKKEKIAWVAFGVLVALIAANWQGDLVSRRIAFAGVILALALPRFLKKWWWVFAIYLLPITLSNLVLYAKGNPFVAPEVPDGQVLIQTHYLKPFTKYDGIILWIGESNLGQIDEYLASGRRVFLAPDGITAPYRLLVGNNYHITSLSRVGDSESRFLFEKYEIKKFYNAYEILKFSGKVDSKAGDPVISYGGKCSERLTRRRINYGDIGIWLWSFVTGHKDPTGWIYYDASGNLP